MAREVGSEGGQESLDVGRGRGNRQRTGEQSANVGGETATVFEKEEEELVSCQTGNWTISRRETDTDQSAIPHTSPSPAIQKGGAREKGQGGKQRKSNCPFIVLSTFFESTFLCVFFGPEIGIPPYKRRWPLVQRRRFINSFRNRYPSLLSFFLQKSRKV